MDDTQKNISHDQSLDESNSTTSPTKDRESKNEGERTKMKKGRSKIALDQVDPKSNDETITSSEMDNDDDKSQSKKKKTPRTKARRTSPELRRNLSPTNRKRADTTRSSSPLTTSETTSEEDQSDHKGDVTKKLKKKLKNSKTLSESGSKKQNKSKLKSSSNNGITSTESSKSEEGKIDTIPESAEEHSDSITSNKSHSVDDVKSKKDKKLFTVDELTEMLTQPQESLFDKNFINNYILTHQYFIESSELLRRLIDFYYNPGPHITEDQLPFYKMRIINVLKKLIEFRYYDLKNDEQFCTYLKDFLSRLKQGEESERQITSILESSMDKNADFIREDDEEVAPSPIISSCTHNNNNYVKWILDYNPTEFARQHTIIDYNLFKSIKLEDLYHAKFNTDKSSNNVNQFIARFNEISTWVSSSILSIPNKRNRINVLIKHIQVLEELRKLQNYHGMMAFYSALNIMAIRRLKKTWKDVGSKYLALFNNAAKFFDNSQDFKTYRDHLKEVDPPCVPYFGFITGDLTFIEEYPTFVQGKKVNWNKMVLLSKCFLDVLRFQRTRYNLQEIPSFFVLKNSVWSFDEETMLRMSYSLEQDDSVSDSPNKSKSKLSKKDKKAKKTFADLYVDKVLLAQFRNFMHMKFNSENLLFWEDVNRFKEINFANEKNRGLAEARDIISKYIEGTSNDGSYGIGIPTQMKNTILKRMEANDIDESLFDEAHLEIEHSALKTLFSEFLKTEEV